MQTSSKATTPPAIPPAMAATLDVFCDASVVAAATAPVCEGSIEAEEDTRDALNDDDALSISLWVGCGRASSVLVTS
jgi:hypothetical protein